MACKQRTPHCGVVVGCRVAFAHNAPFVVLGLSLGEWDSYDGRGLPENNKGGNTSLQTRGVVSVNSRRKFLLGREAVTVRDVG